MFDLFQKFLKIIPESFGFIPDFFLDFQLKYFEFLPEIFGLVHEKF